MNIGIIGTGYISSIHAAACNSIGLPIVAVADINKDKFMAKKHLYGDVMFFDNTDDLLKNDKVDAVIISTPNNTHAEIIKKAVRAEKHIFGEKTFTDRLDSSRELVKILSGYSKNFQIGFMKRCFPATKKAVELLPEIGDIFSVYVRSYQTSGWDVDIYNNEAWIASDDEPSRVRKSMGAGMLNMAGSHMIDLMGLLVGEPESVYATNWMPANYDVEVTCNAIFKMKNSSTVHFEAALSPYSSVGIRDDGWDEVIEINGTKGKIEIYYVVWNQPTNNAPIVKLYSEESKSWTTFTFPKVNPFEIQLSDFVECCKTGQKSIPGYNEGLYVDKVINHCYESSDKKQVVYF